MQQPRGGVLSASCLKSKVIYLVYIAAVVSVTENKAKEMLEFFEVYLITLASMMGKQYLFLLSVKNMKRKLGIKLDSWFGFVSPPHNVCFCL